MSKLKESHFCFPESKWSLGGTLPHTAPEHCTQMRRRDREEGQAICFPLLLEPWAEDANFQISSLTHLENIYLKGCKDFNPILEYWLNLADITCLRLSNKRPSVHSSPHSGTKKGTWKSNADSRGF